MAELTEHEARNGVESALGRPCPEIEPIEGILSGHHAIDKKGSVLAFDHVRLLTLNIC